MREMRRQAAPNPMMPPRPTPTPSPALELPESRDLPRTDRARANPRINLDPAVLGAAPGTPQPQLRREGEFVINRRGRISRGSGGGQVLFTFEADSEHASEMPMVLLPSQMLQNMEDLVQERGDQVVFVLTGEVTTYHGANYLMPTMWKLAIDRGNLQP
jgi:hypothetical protein